MASTKSKETNKTKFYRYNKLWRRVVIKTVINPLARKYNCITPKNTLPEGANLILANHVTIGDQFIMTGHYPKDYLYYVAGEDAMKSPVFRWIGEHILGVITHMRGVDAIKTTKDMLRHLKKGCNVIVHPEGATSFDGRTKAVDEAISKMAKMGACNLVLIRIEGGYLTKPRWRNSVCKGEIQLYTKVLTKEELKDMKPEEVSLEVNGWLYTDAYEEQAKSPKTFFGDEPCKGLEACIYQCPECGKIGALRTSKKKIFCECGFEATMDDYGYLIDRESNRHTITQFCDQQKEYIEDAIKSAKEKGTQDYLFEDVFNVKKVFKDGKREVIGDAKLTIYTDHAEYRINEKEGTVKLEDVENIFIFKRNQWNCYIAGKEYRYELVGDFSSNALKYQDLWNTLNN